MAAHTSQDIARDIVVAWLSNAGAAPPGFDYDGDKVGEFLGKLFKRVATAVGQSIKDERKH